MDSFEINTGDYDLSSLREGNRNSTANTPETISMGSTEQTHQKSQSQNTPASTQKKVAEKPATDTTRTKNTPKIENPAQTSNRNLDETKQQILEGIAQFFGDGRFKIFIGIFLILLAAVLLVATISYASTHADDQSMMINHTASEIADNHEGVKNSAGWVGSMVANYLFNLIGISSYIIIFYIGAIGVTLVNLYKFKFWQLTFKCLFSACAISIIAGFATYLNVSATYLGGIHGYHVNTILMESTAIWGCIATNLLLISALVLIFLSPIKRVVNQVLKLIKSRKDALAKRYNESMASAQAISQSEETAAVTANDTVEEPTVNDENQQAPKFVIVENESIETNRPLEIIELPSQPKTIEEEPSVEESNVELHKEDHQEKETPELEDISTPALFDAKGEPTLFDEIETVVDTNSAHEIQEMKPTITDDNGPEIIVEKPEIEEAEDVDIDAYDPTAELSHYRFPDIDLLTYRASTISVDEDEREENQQLIINSLRNYGIEISQIKATVGPTITLYEIIPAPGVRIATIRRLADDMALSLSAIGIRIIAPIPGKGTIGMEVPNKNPQTVSIRSILSSKAYHESTAELPVALGTTISNDVYVTDLTKMPHLLVAGATGMGKSVGLNTIIASLLYKKHPAELKFVLVDPKMVEFSLYKCLERHFLAKLPEEDSAIITDSNKVVATLNSLCVEMDSRYELLSMAGMRGIKEYNQKFISRRLNPEKGHRYLPYIVVIIDEFADLILTAGRDVETPISRIAAKARAVGIHMILATQRPSVNVITGTIKANFPARMAFRVTQMNDSRTILDRPGAEQLVGRGDMLMSRDGTINRVQCAFIDTDEVERICKSISDQIGYPNAYELPEMPSAAGEGGSLGAIGDRDPLFAEAGREVIASNMGSASSLQRKFNIGYPRAGKLIDQLEAAGVVGAATGAGKPRPVLMDLYAFENMLEQKI